MCEAVCPPPPSALIHQLLWAHPACLQALALWRVLGELSLLETSTQGLTKIRLLCKFPCTMITTLQKEGHRAGPALLCLQGQSELAWVALQSHKPETKLLLCPLCILSPFYPQGSQNPHDCCREHQPVLSGVEPCWEPPALPVLVPGSGRVA